MSDPVRIAVVGLGKIAHDQHLPAISRSSEFRLVAAATPEGGTLGVPMFSSLEALLDSDIALDAVALCQPPQFRFDAAVRALRAGKHVLLEKPPAASMAQARELSSLAAQIGATILASWHSRHAAAVEPARQRLAGRDIRAVRIIWLEDVRQWHPNQAWIWEPGGLGVFDPGINALSILTHLLPGPLTVREGTLEIPANRQMPIAARVHLDAPSGTVVDALFDWRAQGAPQWSLEFDTSAGPLQLLDGGAVLRVGEQVIPVPPSPEYPDMYRHFASLIRRGCSDIDLEPLRLTEDSFVHCARSPVEPFED